MKKLEILAPAGGADMVSAAVNCGANAVYLGFGSLNARRNAQNFTYDELKNIVDYCHIRNVSVYLTLNILVFDNEFSEVEKYIKNAANMGIDAIIVQDLAVGKLVRAMCPDMPIHGSTQMSVNSVSGAQMLKSMGFNRVVLARELTKSEIKDIVSNVDIETEVFVHGAHCMSVSGQCTMSSMIGQRSGNRGMCAQPCRLPFSKKGSDQHNLSLKDMSIIYDLKQLEQMGVTSAKIEGRMKRPEYVAAAVTACAASLDKKPLDKYMANLEKVFSRSGFTDGFYTGKLDKTMYGTRSKGDVVAAKDVLDELSKLYHKEKELVPITFQYTQLKNQPVSLTVNDEDGNSFISIGDVPQVAINKPTDLSKVYSSLNKLGGTPYYLANDLGSIEFSIDETLIVPVSVINKLRRDCIESLDSQRISGFCKPVESVDNILSDKVEPLKKHSNLPKLRARFLSRESIDVDDLDIYEYIYLPVKLAIEMSEIIEKYKHKIIVVPPRVMFGKEEIILKDFYTAKQLGYTKICAMNIGDFYWAKEMGFDIHGGFGLNCINSLSLYEYANLDAVDMEMSIEIDINHLNKLKTSIPIGVVAYGHVPVMITRNCPGRAAGTCANCRGYIEMYDRLGNKFGMSCNSYKTATEIYNCNPIYMGNRMDDLKQCDFICLYFTNETSDKVKSVTEMYLNKSDNTIENATKGLLHRPIH